MELFHFTKRRLIQISYLTVISYNNIVQEFNTMTDVVPSNLVASLFRFTKLEYLEFEEEIAKRPDLKWQA